MPRRTSLDASKWKQIEEKNPVPSLWELCVDSLVHNLNAGEQLCTLSLLDRKVLAQQIVSRKKITREALELMSSCSDVSSCVTLDLSNSPVTDYGLYLLSGLTNLERLQLYNCKNITNRGLFYLKCNFFIFRFSCTH